MKDKRPESIINRALAMHDPSHVILAISGGYDSLCMAHYVYNNVKIDRTLLVYAIDTQLSADGWREWIDGVAHDYGWPFDIYHNIHGWHQYLRWVEKFGQPRTRIGHTRAYARLKDRAFDAMVRDHKTTWHGRKKINDRILFLTGIRQAESATRSKLTSPHSGGIGKSACFCNPLFYWSNDDVLSYRIENELPINPFYETVGGSGDCQCNWGRFITLRKLQKESPRLSSGNVALLDELSKKYHGYGWDGQQTRQLEMFSDFDDESEMCSPFLCDGCSRNKSPRRGYEDAAKEIYEQMAIW